MKLTAIKDLSGDAIDAQVRSMDWSEGYGDKWDSFEASRCETCGMILIGPNGESHNSLDGSCSCEGYVSQNEGPMMNYFYPLPGLRRGSAEKAAELIVDLPLCLIYLQESDEWGLALTGGGMDLSWEICEAYMRLGYVPPFHFARLPAFAGLKLDARHRWIIAGCRCAAQITIKRARWAIKDLINLKAKMAQPA